MITISNIYFFDLKYTYIADNATLQNYKMSRSSAGGVAHLGGRKFMGTVSLVRDSREYNS